MNTQASSRSVLVGSLSVGSKIWAALSSWYIGENKDLTEYPIDGTQMDLHFVEGQVQKKYKRHLDAAFDIGGPSKRVTLTNDSLEKNSNIYVLSKEELPENAISICSDNDIDFLAGKAPKVPDGLGDNDSAFETISIYQEREREYKKKMKNLWEELLAFKLNHVNFVPVEILSMKLPSIFGTPCQEREDLKKTFSLLQRDALEEIREAINLKMSVVTTTSNNLEAFLGWRVDIIDRMSKRISQRKGEGKFEFEIMLDIPVNLLRHIIIPSLKLTGSFVEEPMKGASVGDTEYLLYRFIGSIEGLKKLGVLASKHSKWRNPYVHVQYITEEESLFGSYYDSLRQKHGGDLPFVVNPNDLTKEEVFDPNSKVRSELGDSYCYHVPAHKIVHGIHLGRLRAAKNDPCRNFGIQHFFMVS
jgi:hypothetical protein